MIEVRTVGDLQIGVIYTFPLRSDANIDDLLKITSVTMKLEMTSLNPHFIEIQSGTRCWSQARFLRFWQLTPTNRTHFLSRFYTGGR